MRHYTVFWFIVMKNVEFQLEQQSCTFRSCLTADWLFGFDLDWFTEIFTVVPEGP